MILGLDPEELGSIVDVAYKDELEEDMAEPVLSRRDKKGCPVKLIIIVVIIAGLVAAGYFYMQSGTATLGNEEATVEVPVQQPPAQQESVEQPVTQQNAVETTEVEPAAPSVQTEEATPEATKDATKETEVAPEPVVVNETPAPVVVAPSDVVAQKAEENAVVTEQADNKADGAMRSLRVEATADCWVEATGDGFTRKEFLLRNGQGY